MGSKNELILVILPLVCAAIVLSSATTAALQSAIAQQEETSSGEDENFARGIVSDVLDGNDDDEVDDEAADDGIVDQDLTDTVATPNPNQDETTVDQADSNQFGDDTNTQIAIPITEQDQRAENQAAQLGLNLDLNLIPSPAPADGQPQQRPEFTPGCPESFELIGEMCFAEPEISCHVGEPGGSEATTEDGRCIIGSSSPLPDGTCPEPIDGGIFGEIRYIPSPFEPGSCAITGEPYPACPYGTDLNADGLCQTPASLKYVVCPEGIVERFEDGYCQMRQVPTCPEGFVFDTREGNCDNPQTGETTDNTFRCPDGSHPDLINGCRFPRADRV
jgi:hypothetical protein